MSQNCCIYNTSYNSRALLFQLLHIQQVVKVILHKAAWPPQTDGSIVFARWRHCALPWAHIGATWGIRLNLCFLRPTQVHNPNSKLVGSAVFAQMTAECPYTLQCDTPLPLKIAHSHRGSGPPSNTWFLGPRVLNPNGISTGSAVFCRAH